MNNNYNINNTILVDFFDAFVTKLLQLSKITNTKKIIIKIIIIIKSYYHKKNISDT